MTTQAALDTWDDAGQSDAFVAALPCLMQTVQELVRFLAEVGVDPPDDLVLGLEWADAFTGSCR